MDENEVKIEEHPLKRVGEWYEARCDACDIVYKSSAAFKFLRTVGASLVSHEKKSTQPKSWFTVCVDCLPEIRSSLSTWVILLKKQKPILE